MLHAPWQKASQACELKKYLPRQTFSILYICEKPLCAFQASVSCTAAQMPNILQTTQLQLHSASSDEEPQIQHARILLHQHVPCSIHSLAGTSGTV